MRIGIGEVLLILAAFIIYDQARQLRGMGGAASGHVPSGAGSDSAAAAQGLDLIMPAYVAPAERGENVDSSLTPGQMR